MASITRAALACLLAWAVLAWGQDLQPVPPLTGRVVDAAGWLTPEQRTRLDERLAGIETQRGSQIAILTVPTTQPEPIEAYSIRVVDAWKLGRKGVDDGVLILLARNDRAVRIEVGRGLEGAIPDAMAKRIVEEQMIPHFREGDVAGGLEAGIAAIEARVAGEPLPPPAARAGRESRESGEGGWLGWALMAALLGGQVLRVLLGRLLGAGVTASLVGAGVWWFSGSLLFGLGAALVALIFLAGGGWGGPGPWIGGGGRRGGWGGGLGGSGGWSGGGGGFSGGGASGRW